jgi:gamma-glutamyltranspeptidase
MPRFLSGRFGLDEARDTLHVESRLPAVTISQLETLGHVIHHWGPWNEMAGHTHGILVNPTFGTLVGGSDPRSDGVAIGY